MKIGFVIAIGLITFFTMIVGLYAVDAATATKPITHFLVYDLTKNDFVSYDSAKDVQVFVIGPNGVTPAVVVDESKDGTKVLVCPTDIAKQLLAPIPVSPDTEPLHSADSQ